MQCNTSIKWTAQDCRVQALFPAVFSVHATKAMELLDFEMINDYYLSFNVLFNLTVCKKYCRPPLKVKYIPPSTGYSIFLCNKQNKKRDHPSRHWPPIFKFSMLVRGAQNCLKWPFKSHYAHTKRSSKKPTVDGNQRARHECTQRVQSVGAYCACERIKMYGKWFTASYLTLCVANNIIIPGLKVFVSC